MQKKWSGLVILLLIMVYSPYCYGLDRIQVIIPSAKAEAEYVWRTLEDILFFEAQGYELSLPKGLLIEELKQKSRSDELTDNDYERLKQFMLDSVYDRENYQEGYQKIKDQLGLINQMVNQLNTLRFDWSFKTFDTYTVNLTLYGPGGSFNPEEGSLLLFTTPEGIFKNYKNPANTIIHEIVHIGIDESIISKYQVPHALKERIVDTFVFLNFKSFLIEYRIQDMGEYRIDPHLKQVEDFKELDKIVSRLLKK